MDRTKRSLAQFFSDYQAYHQSEGNKVTHYFGIPMIMIAILGLLARIAPEGDALVRLDGGTVILALAAAWYITKDWRIGAPFIVFTYGLYFAGRAMSLPWLWGFFVVGWVLQLVGHAVWEKRSPAFTKNLEHLLVGPIWIFAKLMGYKP